MQKVDFDVTLYSKDTRKTAIMANITINLPDSQLNKLEDLAKIYGIPVEVLLRASIEEWLSSSKRDFTHASEYVLNKNAELYRRLA